MSWLKIEASAYEAMIELLPKPLDKTLVLADLGALKQREIDLGIALPGTRALARRWGWPYPSARKFLLREEPLWNHFGTTLEPLGNHFGTRKEPLDNDSTKDNQKKGTTLEPLWNHFGTTLEPLWNQGIKKDEDIASKNDPLDIRSKNIDKDLDLYVEHTREEEERSALPPKGMAETPQKPKKARKHNATTEGVLAYWKEKRGSIGNITRRGLPHRVRDYGEEAVREVIDWAISSPDSTAKFLREKQLLDGGTLWDPEKFKRYLGLAQSEKSSKKPNLPTTPTQQHQKPGIDRDAVLRALRKRT